MMSIELTDNEAMAFRLLAESGAWNLKKGSATLHFDKDGTPTSVEVRSFTFVKVIHSPDTGHDLQISI